MYTNALNNSHQQNNIWNFINLTLWKVFYQKFVLRVKYWTSNEITQISKWHFDSPFKSWRFQSTKRLFEGFLWASKLNSDALSRGVTCCFDTVVLIVLWTQQNIHPLNFINKSLRCINHLYCIGYTYLWFSESLNKGLYCIYVCWQYFYCRFIR